MGRKKKDQRIVVWKEGERVGIITRKNNEISFQYETEWVRLVGEKLKNRISYSFPISTAPIKGVVVENFFSNLLPDEKSVRDILASNVRAESSDSFDLLSAIGGDCVGAYQYFKEGFTPPNPITEELNLRPLSEQDIEHILINLPQNPNGVSMADEFRISIAGAHSKTALFQDKKNKSWFKPHGTTPTTHILKPPLGIFNNYDLSLSCENEHFCLTFLNELGFSTCKSEVGVFGKQKALVVERFDRKEIIRNPDCTSTTALQRYERVSIEDICQALGVSSAKKYEERGGPGFQDICRFLMQSDAPREDVLTFWKAQVTFWLLGATDGHAKNFSIFHTSDGFKIAPLYDVLSVQPLIDKGQMAWKVATLAFAMGKDREKQIKYLNGKDFLRSAETIPILKDDQAAFYEFLQESSKAALEIAKEKVLIHSTNKEHIEIVESICNGFNSRLSNLT